MDGSNGEISKAWRVHKTCLKMLEKRGYCINEAEKNFTLEDFKETKGEDRINYEIFAENENDASDQILVFFPTDEKVGVKPLKTYAIKMKDMNVMRAIIVVKENMTPFAKSALKELTSRGFRMEYFKEAELLVDITEHKLVPEHTVLTQPQKDSLLQRYRLKPTQLPKIQQADPVARYYGLKPGQVVQIVRPSETAGRYITYRICI